MTAAINKINITTQTNNFRLASKIWGSYGYYFEVVERVAKGVLAIFGDFGLGKGLGWTSSEWGKPIFDWFKQGSRVLYSVRDQYYEKGPVEEWAGGYATFTPKKGNAPITTDWSQAPTYIRADRYVKMGMGFCLYSVSNLIGSISFLSSVPGMIERILPVVTGALVTVPMPLLGLGAVSVLATAYFCANPKTANQTMKKIAMVALKVALAAIGLAGAGYLSCNIVNHVANPFISPLLGSLGARIGFSRLGEASFLGPTILTLGHTISSARSTAMYAITKDGKEKLAMAKTLSEAVSGWVRMVGFDSHPFGSFLRGVGILIASGLTLKAIRESRMKGSKPFSSTVSYDSNRTLQQIVATHSKRQKWAQWFLRMKLSSTPVLAKPVAPVAHELGVRKRSHGRSLASAAS